MLKYLLICTVIFCTYKLSAQVKLQSKKSTEFADTAKVTDNAIKIYADSISSFEVKKNNLPNFIYSSCIDDTPPLFVGFHSSFRWEVLQKVNNAGVLKELLDFIPKNAKEVMIACNIKNKKRKIMYSNLSFYTLLELRYNEIIKKASLK